MHHTKTTLKNGMRVITVPMKDTKSLTLLALFGTGSRYETKRTNGVSHFLEHLFFKGTKSRPRPGEVSQALDDIGAQHNAFTAKEYTGYWVKAASHHASLALEIVADILLEPLFKAEEIEKERGVIFQEMSMYLDTPRQHVHDIFESLLYGDHPMGWEVIGTSESLRALRRQDILTYRKAHYRGSNAVLVVAGACDEEKIQCHIADMFSRLSDGVPKEKMLPVKHEEQKQPAAHMDFKKTDQTHLVMGTKGYSMFDDRRYALMLLATVLGGKTSSRLFQEIREKRGLAYTISAMTEQFKDTGYISIYAGVPHQKTKEVVRRIRNELRKVRRGVSGRELQRAKDYWRGQFAISLESSDEVASFYGGRELFYGNIISPEEVMARIEDVPVAAMKKVAEDLFKPGSLCLAVIGPHRESMEFEELLVV